jgi:hypothetical protein
MCWICSPAHQEESLRHDQSTADFTKVCEETLKELFPGLDEKLIYTGGRKVWFIPPELTGHRPPIEPPGKNIPKTFPVVRR